MEYLSYTYSMLFVTFHVNIVGIKYETEITIALHSKYLPNVIAVWKSVRVVL